MSRYWPHTSFAEDQPLSRSILYTHVLTRGITVGTGVGLLSVPTRSLLRRFKLLSPSPLPPTTLLPTFLRSGGTGALVGFGLFSLTTTGRMWGRERIEWQDRSWRLIENKGQVECDDWTYPLMGIGAAAGGYASSQRAGTALSRLRWRGVVGGAGIGSIVGMMGYMGWRYGVKGGEFEDVV